MTIVTLRKVDLVLADFPAKLRGIADDLKLGIPEAGQQLAADQLYDYAASIEHFVQAIRAREAGLSR